MAAMRTFLRIPCCFKQKARAKYRSVLINISVRRVLQLLDEAPPSLGALRAGAISGSLRL